MTNRRFSYEKDRVHIAWSLTDDQPYVSHTGTSDPSPPSAAGKMLTQLIATRFRLMTLNELANIGIIQGSPQRPVSEREKS